MNFLALKSAASLAALARLCLMPGIVFFALSTLHAADYQFGLDIPKSTTDPMVWTDTHAFLWIPPHAKKIRAIILAPANIIERRMCSDPIVRAEAEQDGVALLYFQAGWKGALLESPALLTFITSMLDQLADISGYPELKTVPWIPLGHSGNSQFCQDLARVCPERTLADVVIKGALPAVAKDGSTTGLTGIPILFVTGQFEEVMPPGRVRDAWWGVQLQRLVPDRAAVPQSLIAGLEDRSHGHLNWFPDMSHFVCDYIHKAILTRLNPDDSNDGSSPVKLRAVDYAGGWLVDPAGQVPGAAPAQFKGDASKAFWLFDSQLAAEWQSLMDKDKGKKEQLLAFIQDGQVVPWWNGWGVQDMKFEPLPDGQSFTVKAQFRDEVPAPFADAGTKIGHGDPAKIRYEMLGWAGNIEQTGPDTFRVAFDREGVNGRTLHVLVGAIHPGDDQFRETVAVAGFFLPSNNTGTNQTITFPPIPDVKLGTETVPLKASLNSGRMPRYYVNWGPAEVEGDHLKIIDVPDRAKFPIEIKVTAYEWGSASDPKFASAHPMTQVFHLVKP